MRAPSAAVALGLGALLTPALLVLSPAGAAPDRGDDAELVVAARVNGMSVDRLTTLLESNPSAELDVAGRLLFKDRAPAGRTAASSAVPSADHPYADTFLLHSLPGAQRTIYLDFDGHTVSGTAWNDLEGLRSGFYPGLSVDGSAAFTEAEKDIVQDVWQRVAEDYAPFQVDVTTQDPGLAALTRSSSADQVYGMRALVTAENWCAPGCLGVAYVDVFDRIDATGFTQPAWAFSGEAGNDPIQIAESISHEVGHTLGLLHDGERSGSEYFLGHGMWSPIMGAGFGALTQFSTGEYADANQTQDDLAVMASSGIPLRADDHGALPNPLAGSTTGTIERRTDTDVFSVVHGCAGPLTVSATPARRGPNLDIRLTVTPPVGAPTSVDPVSGRSSTFVPTGLDATYSADLPAGTYQLTVDGVGARDARTTGYSDYGSLGGYRLAVTSPCLDPVLPDGPASVTTSVTSTSATLRWQPPLSDGGAAVTEYVARLGGSVVTLGPAARRHTFTDLTPATAYALSVVARTAVGDSPTVTRSVRTAATRPGRVRIGTAESGRRGGAVTAKARWSAPTSTGGSPITGYKVLARRLSPSGATLSTTVVRAAKDARRLVVRLRAGRYRFEVRALNAQGAGPWSPRSNKVLAR